MSNEHSSIPADWQVRLEPDERVVWTGRPVPGFLLRDITLREATRGIFIAGLGFYLLYSGWGQQAPPNTMRRLRRIETSTFWDMIDQYAFIIPYVVILVGLWTLFARVGWNSLQLLWTRYALTDRRAFIVRRLWGQPRVSGFRIREMKDLELVHGFPGCVIFSKVRRIIPYFQYTSNTTAHGFWSEYERIDKIGFRRIRDAAQVSQMIRQRREAVRNAG